uniref:Uncharacterized protein n=1 Tax=Anguilla anguilla TaxID=7936 RepID=A0A0E9SF55_ANGAN
MLTLHYRHFSRRSYYITLYYIIGI